MYKFKIAKLFLSLVTIINSLNFVCAQNTNHKQDLFKQDVNNIHCKWNFNFCGNNFNTPFIATTLSSVVLAGLYYSNDNHIVFQPQDKSVKTKYDYFYHQIPIGPLNIPFQASISTIPASIILPFSSSLSSVPDPLISSTISNVVSSAPASSTGISSVPASTSFASANVSFASRISLASPATISSSPITFPSIFTFMVKAFPRINLQGFMKVDYVFPIVEDYTTRKKDYEFNSVVTFGDSLSDTGSYGRFVVYMANGTLDLYNTYLSKYYSGKYNAHNNNIVRGPNFAHSGATIDDANQTIFNFRVSTKDEIRWYLSDHGGKADPNSVYIYWMGGNDLANKLSSDVPLKILWNMVSFNPQKNKEIFDQDGFYDDKKTISSMVQQVGDLLDAGAGYVYFMNLPVSGYTPFTQMLAEGATLGSVDIILERTPLMVLSPSYWLSKIADDYLRNTNNHIGEPTGRGWEYIIENNIAALKHRYFFLPKSWLRVYYNFGANLQNSIIRQFNNEAKRQLSSIKNKGNIIYTDVDGLFTEILDDYKSYGIDEVLVPQCQLGLQSTACDETDTRYHNDKIYAFTDWHHLSAYSHMIIFHYMASIFDAPVYVASLTRNLENLDISRRYFINGQLKDFRKNMYNINGYLIPIIGYSGLSAKLPGSFIESKQDNTNILNVGIAYANFSNLVLGVIGSFGFGKQIPHNEINFKQNNQSLTLLGQYIYDNYWVNASITGGIYKANDINRIIKLGSANRIEKGSTKGRLYNFSFNTGYNFNITENFIVSPNIGFTTSKYKINAYEENNNLSTSMRFGKQNSTSNIVSVGLDLSNKSNTSFAISYNHRLNSKELILNSVGLKSTDLTFSRKGMNYKSGKSNDWIDISPRINIKLSENMYLNAGVGYQFDLKNKKNSSKLNYNIGLKASFN